MKTKSIFYNLIGTLIVLALFLHACNKEEEPSNQTPSCSITNPLNGEEIIQGETITISVEATDSDGTIKEVQFSINGIGRGNATSFPYNYSWNTSNENVSEHTLKAKSIDNNGGSKTDEVKVEIIDGGDSPIAEFIANPTNGASPLTVSFTDQSQNNPTTWSWEFGDGATSTEQNPVHIYNTNGSYTVTLSVSNYLGTDIETKDDYIAVANNGSPPSAYFYTNQTSGEKPFSVEFVNESTHDPTSYYWDFGDGNTSTLESPSHIYQTEGVYTVSLTANNEFGSDTETKNDYITIYKEITPGNYTDPRDGQIYNILEIGNQIWFAENLNYEGVESWWYNNDASYGDNHGRLYRWDAAIIACPNGWHLTSDEEWVVLENYLADNGYNYDGSVGGGRSKIAKALGSEEIWEYSAVEGAVGNTDYPSYRNKSGFTAQPSGSYSYYINDFMHIGVISIWWTSTENGNSAYNRRMNYDYQYTYRQYSSKTSFGSSVRCIKD